MSSKPPQHVGETSAPTSGRSLPQAVATALGLVGILIAGVVGGPPVFFVVIIGVVLLALYELLVALRTIGLSPSVTVGLASALGLLVVAYLERPAWFGVVLIASLYAVFLYSLRPGRGPRPGTDAAWTTLGIFWIGGGGAAATGVMRLEEGELLLLGFVAIAALNDIGAYFVGTNAGKHKLAPSISPGKSWEGAIAGFVVSLLAGLGVAAVLERLTLADGLALGVICGVLVPAGDLVESMVKREIGIKDSGRLLPGHGGMLDRLDAILFTAPAIFLYLRLIAQV